MNVFNHYENLHLEKKSIEKQIIRKQQCQNSKIFTIITIKLKINLNKFSIANNTYLYFFQYVFEIFGQ